MRMRLRRGNDPSPGSQPDESYIEIDASQLSGVFAAPRWLRNVGFTAWLLVGVALFLAGAIWFLSLVQTIVVPFPLPATTRPTPAPDVRPLRAHGIAAAPQPQARGDVGRRQTDRLLEQFERRLPGAGPAACRRTATPLTLQGRGSCDRGLGRKTRPVLQPLTPAAAIRMLLTNRAKEEQMARVIVGCSHGEE